MEIHNPKEIDTNNTVVERGLILSIGQVLVRARFSGKERRLPLANYIQSEAAPSVEQLLADFAGTNPETGIPFTAIEAKLCIDGARVKSAEINWSLICYGRAVDDSISSS